MKTTLTRRELSERWGITEKTVINYEQDGIIKAMPLPKPLYSLAMILEIEGTDLDTLSPIEKRRLETEIKYLEEENKRLKTLLLELGNLGQKANNELLKTGGYKR